MKTSFIYRNNSSRLLLIYAGWSVDASYFKKLHCSGYDIAVAYEYSRLNVPEIGNYDEVVLIAWSLGVHAAEMTASGLPLTLTIAVNGTSTPVSDKFGIPEVIYSATAQNLSEQTLAKFRKRMGAPDMPRGERNIQELQSELLNFPCENIEFRWDRAIISVDDRIFPPANQRRAWHDKAEITMISGGHTPDFQEIIDRFVINKPLVTERFTKGQSSYDAASEVQKKIADNLFDLWVKYGLTADSVLEIGSGTGYLTNKYKSLVHKITQWDISPMSADVIKIDAEVAIRKVCTPFDAIVSASTMQWFNSAAAFMNHCVDAIRTNGLVVLSTFGPETFHELTTAGVIPLPYLGEQSLRRIIPIGFEILELHSELIIKQFSSQLDVLRHLKATGVNSRSSNCNVREIMRRYPQNDNGKYELTYQPIYVILKRK